MAERIFGKYEKIRRLAQGGMGDVFLGRQSGVVGFDRLVILKSLRKELADEEGFIEQFLDEARVAANLNHPNVVSIFEVGEWQGVYFIAMEYIAGEDLSRLWYAAAKRGLGLPFSVTVKIVQDAALGLDHAHHAVDVHGHELRIVHRDISPQNIMVRGDGVTKVVDFGIAKATNKVSKTQVGTVKGKLQYMSPEQVKGEILDGRSDQFSLGVVLWEMCTGKRLFKAESEIETLNKILGESIPSPAGIVRNFPGELEEVILKMLHRDRDKRYVSCKEVAAELGGYIERAGKQKAITVGQFVQDVLGDQLKERTQDLTPDEPETRDPEETIATTEGEPIATDEDQGGIHVQRVNGEAHRFADFPALKVAIRSGQLIAGDRIHLGRGKSMALMEHPQLASLFVQPAGLRDSTAMDTHGDTHGDTHLSTEDGLPEEDAMPAPHARAPENQNLSLMAVPRPGLPSLAVGQVPSAPAPTAPMAPHQATGAPATLPPSPPPNTQAAPSPMASYNDGAPDPAGPSVLGASAASMPGSPEPQAGPMPQPGPIPQAGPAPHLSGPMQMQTMPWGPAAPPYQMPTSPPGYPQYQGAPQGYGGPDAWAQTGNIPSVSQPMAMPKRSRMPWVVALVLLVVVGGPVGLYFGDRALFEQLKGQVLGQSAPTLTSDSLRAALFSDDEQALTDALRTVEPKLEQGDTATRAQTSAQFALLHAGLAHLELERVRLYGLAGTDDTSKARVQAAESAAAAHRVAAYRGANGAVALSGDLRDAYVAKAAYQGLLGATQQMEADFKRALDVASPDELKWLQAESRSLRALVELRRATAQKKPSKASMQGALDLVRTARSAEKSAEFPIVDRRLEYAEAALLVELALLGAEDKTKTRGVIEALSRAQPKSDRLRLLDDRLGGKRGKPSGTKKPKPSPTPGTATAAPAPAAPTYNGLKKQADRARRKEQTGKAISLYRQALKLKKTGAAYAGLGWAHLDNDDADAAVDAFENAVQRSPGWPLAVFGQAEALRFSGRKSSAIRSYKAYLEMAPDGEDAPVARRALKNLGG